MKKFLAFVCAAVLTVASAVTAFAQPSVTVNGVVTGIASATDKNKNAVELVMEDGTDTTFAKYTDEQKKLINAIKDQATLKTLLGDKYTDSMPERCICKRKRYCRIPSYNHFQGNRCER